MSTSRDVLAFALLTVATVCALAQDAGRFAGIGRAATPAEVAAWDIDVRPDFKGLPPGSGSVAKGQAVWEGKCASCHGVFGESNEVFNPLVGGTTEEDIRTGHVASLRRPDYPSRTTLMKLSSLSTLWDYINRAMPWDAPKSLSVEEVYAVTAYMLSLGRIVPDDFVLGDRNIAQVQQRLPNRHGATTAHALWPGKELRGAARPDVVARACMANCPVEAQVTSLLPDFARSAHGNLAEQNRTVGAQRGANTAHPPAPASQTLAQGGASPPATIPVELLQKNSCTACHAPQRKLVGPSWSDVAKRHAGQGDYLAGKIRAGGSGAWGNIPMPPQAISAQDAGRIAQWLASGAAP
jgi:cytochrome c551/c552